MIAWGIANGQWPVPELVTRVVTNGYQWLAIEWDDPGTQDANRAAYPELRQRLHDAGKLCGPWFTEGGSIYLTPPDADLTIAEIEGPGDYVGVEYCESQGLLPPGVPKAVCTNFSGVGQAEARFLIDHGYSCLTEAYLNENPNATPDNLDRLARSLGWPTSQPVFGVYPVGGNPVPSYAQWKDWPGVSYLGEYVI